MKGSCKYCNTKRLIWENTSHGWRLINPDGTYHTCPKYPKTTASTTHSTINTYKKPVDNSKKF